MCERIQFFGRNCEITRLPSAYNKNHNSKERRTGKRDSQSPHYDTGSIAFACGEIQNTTQHKRGTKSKHSYLLSEVELYECVWLNDDAYVAHETLYPTELCIACARVGEGCRSMTALN